MTKTNESNCLLALRCKLAGSAQCTQQCPSYIAMHGANGAGGRVGAAGVPADYRNVTLNNSPARADQEQVYANLANYVATFERQFDGEQTEGQRRIKSVYLYSKAPGTGKTTTAIALLNEWLIAHYVGSLKRGKQSLQIPAYFLDVNEWQTAYNEFNRPRVPDHIAEPAAARYYKALERAKTAQFVVLDDVGLRDCSEGFRGDLHAIINARVTNQLPTVYTSNIPIKYEGKRELGAGPYDLRDVFGEERLADRIGDQCSVQNFVGTSKRGKR